MIYQRYSIEMKNFLYTAEVSRESYRSAMLDYLDYI